jgi:ADP-dependent NAD(P)H-hydrate dehydratase
MTPVDLDDFLAASPLPPIDGDKITRGSALIVAGDPSCPGAAILAATAALRAGAGRVQIISHPTVATAIATALPEALATGWDGDSPPTTEITDLVSDASAVLIGPGLDTRAATTARNLAPFVPAGTPLLLDAGSLAAAPDLRGHQLIALPNTDEADALADALGLADREQSDLALRLAERLGAVAAVRGPTTTLSDGRQAWRTEGHPALGTAGSGDVLAGLVTGLAARELSPLTAAAWAIAIHSEAGTQLGGTASRAAYLASELLAVIPTAIDHTTDRVDGRRSAR